LLTDLAAGCEAPQSSVLSSHPTLPDAYAALDAIAERCGRFGLVDVITVLVVDGQWQPTGRPKMQVQ
jgi:hypothetical protein